MYINFISRRIIFHTIESMAALGHIQIVKIIYPGIVMMTILAGMMLVDVMVVWNDIMSEDNQ